MLPPIDAYRPWPGRLPPPQRIRPVAPAAAARPVRERLGVDPSVGPRVWTPGPASGRGQRAVLAYGALERQERAALLSALLGIDLLA